MASAHSDQHPAIPLHRGTYTPDFPRYVRSHTGEELSRMAGDPDAVFAVDLNEWLDRGERIGAQPPINWLDVIGAAFAALVIGIIIAAVRP